MESTVVTIEDRIEVRDEFKEYFDEFIPFVERIKSVVWHKITKERIRDRKTLIKMVMDEFGVKKVF